MFCIVILAGGAARRFGSDKLAAPLGGTTVFERCLTSLPSGHAVIVVGPRRSTAHQVTWVHEEPAGAGPMAGIAAALPLCRQSIVAICPADTPFAGLPLRLMAQLASSRPGIDGVVAHDGEYPNPLWGVYQRAYVQDVLPKDPVGSSARALFAGTILHHHIEGVHGRDVDTPDDLSVFTRLLSSPDEAQQG